MEATQLKAAARHLKSVTSREQADKMVAKVPVGRLGLDFWTPVGCFFSVGVFFSGE